METKPVNFKFRHAVIRAISAVLLALIFLAITGFAFIKLISGPSSVSDFDNVSDGDYVTANISLIMDFYAEGYAHTDGDATTLYAVTAGDEYFYTVIVPKRYFDSANTINQDTLNFMLGTRSSLNRYFTVTGTIYTLSDTELSYLYNWFTENMQWLQSSDVIGEVSDYSDYLSVYALRVDYIGNLPTVWVYILSSLAWLLLVYAIIVFIRIALGKYSVAAVDTEATEAKATEAVTQESLPAVSDATPVGSPDQNESSTKENEVNDSDES